MHDALRRILTVALVCAITAATFLLIRPNLPGGYGLLDFLRGTPAPEKTTGNGSTPPEQFTTPNTSPLTADDVPLLDQLSNDIATLVSRVRPSVVFINTTQRFEVAGLRISSLGIFKDSQLAERPGLGSGVITTAEGHIVTNHHVIEDVDEIEVTTYTGKTYAVDLIGTDPSADIAVLKLRGGDSTTFPALPFGDSSKVRVGQMVLALGNPYYLGDSVTQGIISALPRQVTETAYKTFQTDTAINPGNSGGPLVNTRGEIIGINNSVFNSAGTTTNPQGLSFAIPSNDARTTFETIMSSKRSIIGFLGVNTNNLSDITKFQLGIRDGRGVMAVEVAPESPAEASGLQPGDIILSFDSVPVTDTTNLYKHIGAHRIGTDANIEIIRDTAKVTLTATIVDKADYLAASADRRRQEEEGAAKKISNALGITVENLTVYQRHRLGIDRTAPAIYISGIEQESPLRGKLQAFDLITQINDVQIYTTRQFFEEIDKLPFDEKSTLYFIRQQQRLRVNFTPRNAPPTE